MKNITIFTPTYNRAHTLTRLHKSLLKQDSYDFEWLIVDDGSNDDTEKIVEQFVENTEQFPIRYYKRENGGKHRAINYALKLAEGELFFIVDSDDWLPSTSISNIILHYKEIKGKDGYAGVAGCKFDSRNIRSGTTFSGQVLDATSLERNKYGITGEKAEVFITEVLRKYPFPEYEGERFISEAVVWNKIAFEGYKLRWFNENIYFFEYQEDGLTNHLRENYRKNPRGYLLYIGNEIKYLKVSYLKKLIWCGKCINTITLETVTKKEVLNFLNINAIEYIVSKLIFNLYVLMR